MTGFRTEIKINSSEHKINYQDIMISMGSCFSDNIGGLLTTLKFDCTVNPFGIIYNPVSICRLIHRTLEQKKVVREELHQSGGLHVHLDFHSKLATTDSHSTLNLLNNSLVETGQKLKKATYLLITFGTAYVYTYEGNIVANCHKMPGRLFEKSLLDIDHITSDFNNINQKLLEQNPDLKIILTVSPVRHIKEGLENNQRSKSRLLETAAQLQSQNENVFYFPAYEIMMDDLRDYRFYEADLIHPNKTAIDYIWQHFKSRYFDQKTMVLTEKIHKINKAVSHRPFNPNSEEYKDFCKQQLEKISDLQEDYPFLDFSEEIKQLRKKSDVKF